MLRGDIDGIRADRGWTGAGESNPAGSHRTDAGCDVIAGLVLIPLLAVPGVTSLFVGRLLSAHPAVGMLLINPAGIKLSTTGFRFLQYNSGDRPYRKKGPPVLWPLALGPMMVASTVMVFLSGILVLLEDPNAPGGFLLIHKAGFVVWLAVAALHVVGHHAVRTSDGLGSHRGDH